MTRTLHLLAPVAAIACAGADAEPSGCRADGLASTRQAIMGGAPSSGWGDAMDQAVGAVAIRVQVENVWVERLCTATRVERGRALTARHCLNTGGRSAHVEVNFEPVVDHVGDGCAERLGFWVSASHVHPDLDLALLEFDESERLPSTLPLAPVAARPGASALLAGYGLTHEGTLGERRFVSARVVDRDERGIFVEAVPEGGACIGDSGGPLLLRDEENGSVVIGGVLHGGSASCLGRDLYTDLDAARTWLESFAL